MNQGMMSSWILRPFAYHFQEKTLCRIGHLRQRNERLIVQSRIWLDNQLKHKARMITQNIAEYEYLASFGITETEGTTGLK